LLLLAGGGFTLISLTAVGATLSSNATNTTTTPSPLSSGIKLSPQPLYQLQALSTELSMTPINQTHLSATLSSGNGTLTLPNNTTQTINTTSNATALISIMTPSAQGKLTIRTENGETATATFYEIDQSNNNFTTSEGRGIVIAVFHTNSTTSGGSMLAPLNGMIAAGIDDMKPNGDSTITLWK
jgi:hypothetical protein